MSPRRLHGNPIRRQLERLGIPTTSYFFEKPMEDLIAQERYTLLSLLDDPQDTVSLRCWLGFGHDDGRRAGYRRLRQFAFEAGVSPFEALEALCSGEIKIPWTKEICARWMLLRQELKALEGLVDSELVDALFPEGVEAVEELRELSVTLVEKEPFYDSLTASVLRRAIMERVINPEPPGSDDRVRIIVSSQGERTYSQTRYCGRSRTGLAPINK